MGDPIFAEIRARLDPTVVARQLGLKVKGKDFDCPACSGRLKARSNDGMAWRCVKCDQTGDCVDMFEAVLRLTKAEAIQEAAKAAGVEDLLSGNGPVDRSSLPPPIKRPEVVEFTISETDLGLRYDALTVAALHYQDVRLHGVKYVQRLGASSFVAKNVGDGIEAARAYLAERGIPALDPYPIPVGVAPAWETGLAERLEADGGEALVEAAARAGLLVTRKGGAGRGTFEFFRGRLILPWIGTDGRAIYMKGRAIPRLVEPMRLGRKESGVLRQLGLRTATKNPEKAPHVMHPVDPFGLPWVDEIINARGGKVTVLAVEGELDALSALVAGVPAVATGGIAGIGVDALKRWAGTKGSGVNLLVLSDNDWKASLEQAREGKAKSKLKIEIVARQASKLAGELGCRWALVPRSDTAGDLNEILVTRGIMGVDATYLWAKRNAVEPGPMPPAWSFLPSEVGAEAPQADLQLETMPPGQPLPPKTKEDKARSDVPERWEIRNGELYSRTYDKGSHEWTSMFTGIRRPPVIDAIIRDVGTEIYYVELHSQDLGGGRLRVTTTRSKIAAKNSIIDLADQGLDVNADTSTAMCRWLVDYEYHNRATIPVIHGSTQFGWHGSVRDKTLTFLLGDKCVGPLNLRYVGEDKVAIRAMRQRGTIEGWREIPEIMARYPVALVSLYAAMAAPCIKFVEGVTGFSVELAGASTTGKTTVVNAVGSALCAPQSGYVRSGGSGDTLNGMEHAIAIGNDMPFLVEDTHKLPFDHQSKLIMMLANGEGKARSNRAGTGRLPVKRWSSVGITNAEASVVASTTLGGVGARCLCFEPPMKQHTSATGLDIARLDAVGARHHGLAFPLWVKYLQAGGWRDVVTAYRSWLSHVLENASNDTIQQRWAKPWAIVLAVAEVASQVFGMNAKSNTSVIAGLCATWFDDQRTPDQARACLDLAIEAAATRFDDVTRDDEGGGKRGQKELWIRIMANGNIAFSYSKLKRMLKEQAEASLDTVMQVWRDRGWLATEDKTKVVRIGHGTIRCVVIDGVTAGDFSQVETEGHKADYGSWAGRERADLD